MNIVSWCDIYMDKINRSAWTSRDRKEGQGWQQVNWMRHSAFWLLFCLNVVLRRCRVNPLWLPEARQAERDDWNDGVCNVKVTVVLSSEQTEWSEHQSGTEGPLCRIDSVAHAHLWVWPWQPLPLFLPPPYMLTPTSPQGPTQPWLISSRPSGICSTHNLSTTRTLQLQHPASALPLARSLNLL